eukprot:2090975-Rhodomonas_salina.1
MDWQAVRQVSMSSWSNECATPALLTQSYRTWKWAENLSSGCPFWSSACSLPDDPVHPQCAPPTVTDWTPFAYSGRSSPLQFSTSNVKVSGIRAV